MLRTAATSARRAAGMAGVTRQRAALAQVRTMSYKVPTSSAEITGKVQNDHKSNAEELMRAVPVVEVDGNTAVCDGGGGSLGHPLEYIQLNTVYDQPQACKYCGLRYKRKAH